MADIDRFKLVNDQFGHDLGDQVLVAVAASLLQRLPANAVVARLGGDEFAVLIPGAVDGMSLGQLEALRQIEIPPDTRSAGPSQVSLSIGVTHTTAGDENDVLRQSDVAMYAAKAGGRGQVAVFGEEAAALVHESQSITALVENLRRQNERLHHEARTDARTGLANSRALGEVESNIVGGPNSSWSSCGVIFVDIDHFGAFNHLYGDHAGDEALKCVAGALRRAGRKTDQVFRKGGEEFVMVLPMAAPDALARVAEHLAQRIAELKIPHAEGPTGWLSALIVGVSALPLETVGQAIVRAGDEAMRCKATGVRAQIVLAA
jgi:diguanylate cyclase (GGDEF)-like protein